MQTRKPGNHKVQRQRVPVTLVRNRLGVMSVNGLRVMAMRCSIEADLCERSGARGRVENLRKMSNKYSEEAEQRDRVGRSGRGPG